VDQSIVIGIQDKVVFSNFSSIGLMSILVAISFESLNNKST
jgi:hypothetical protein